MKPGKYYENHYRNVIYPLFISKYQYTHLENLPKLRNLTTNFCVSGHKQKYLAFFHYFWSILYSVKKQNLWYYVKKEFRKVNKRKIVSYFSYRLTKTHLFFLLEHLSFVGFGSILNNPFLLKKQGRPICSNIFK